MAYNGVSEGRRGSQGSTGSALEGEYYADYNYGVSVNLKEEETRQGSRMNDMDKEI